MDVGIAEELDGKSDHRAPYVTFAVQSPPKMQRRRGKVRIGWTPKLDEQKHPADYHNALGQALDASNGIEDPTAVIVQAAL